MCRAPVVSTNVCVYKASPDAKLGLSFHADEEREVRVRTIHPGSLAERCGLLPEDTVCSINGTPCKEALGAARMLRESTGELWLTVERRLACQVGDESGEESDYMLSPPRRLFSPPKASQEAYEEDDEDVDAPAPHDDYTYDEASAEEWKEVRALTAT